MRRATTFVLLTLLAAAAFPSVKRKQAPRTPGIFDYYVLSLSWSPQYCAGPSGGRDSFQCGEGRRFGFVVHGLWPQFERGYPADCEGPRDVSEAIVGKMLPLMPSRRLIRHEWSKHGTCSGLGPDAYFDLVRRAYAAVRIPDEYKAPVSEITVSPDSVRKRFVAANPTLPPAGIRVLCGGRFLSEVRVCMSRELKFRACSDEVRDTCRAPEMIMQPVR